MAIFAKFFKKFKEVLFFNNETIKSSPPSLFLEPRGFNWVTTRRPVPEKPEVVMPKEDSKPHVFSPPPDNYKPDPPKDSDPTKILELRGTTGWHLFKKNHHTNLYVTDKGSPLLIRRGEYFCFDVNLDRPMSSEDVVAVRLKVDGMKDVQYGNGTLVLLRVAEKRKSFEDPYQWSGYISETKGSKIKIVIKPACNCLVAKWELEIWVKRANDIFNKHVSGRLAQKVVTLFNPWCKDDPVYHSSEAARQEYVLSQTATHYGDRGEEFLWYIGQFEKSVLNNVWTILQNWIKIESTKMSCPIEMSRSLLAAVCATDKTNGILRCPHEDALKIYDASYYIKKACKDKKPLPAQNFTAAAVLVCLCRSVGLPCRMVSAYYVPANVGNCRAHHTVYDNLGRLVSTNGKWATHYWVEVWMRRPDLSDDGKYDGWQALDIYCGGPCSPLAVKYGQASKLYDTDHFYSLLNAGELYWMAGPKENGYLRFVWFGQPFGRHIYTKAIGSKQKEDIAERYRFLEPTKEEEESAETASMSSENILPVLQFIPKSGKVSFYFSISGEHLFGQTLVSRLQLQNNTETEQEVRVVLSAFTQTMTQTGQDYLKENKPFSKKLQPNERIDHGLEMSLEFQNYREKVKPYRQVIMSCLVEVVGVGDVYLKALRIPFKYPTINMKFERVGEDDVKAVATLHNNLPIVLTEVTVDIFYPRLEKTEHYQVTNIEPDKQYELIFNIRVKKVEMFPVTAFLVHKDIKNVAYTFFISL